MGRMLRGHEAPVRVITRTMPTSVIVANRERTIARIFCIGGTSASAFGVHRFNAPIATPERAIRTPDPGRGALVLDDRRRHDCGGGCRLGATSISTLPSAGAPAAPATRRTLDGVIAA